LYNNDWECGYYVVCLHCKVFALTDSSDYFLKLSSVYCILFYQELYVEFIDFATGNTVYCMLVVPIA